MYNFVESELKSVSRDVNNNLKVTLSIKDDCYTPEQFEALLTLVQDGSLLRTTLESFNVAAEK